VPLMGLHEMPGIPKRADIASNIGVVFGRKGVETGVRRWKGCKQQKPHSDQSVSCSSFASSSPDSWSIIGKSTGTTAVVTVRLWN
jgi:hypothetical protein